jgi:putative ubiquitin-RnfH superfamily antitoxin RatB of RatAB toxin-antitoxin module
MSKHCRVVWDTAQGVRECQLELPDSATVGDALELARPSLGATAAERWDGLPIGIFGRMRARDWVTADGDRIEIYRPLLVDPRQQRRRRAARAAGRNSG